VLNRRWLQLSRRLATPAHPLSTILCQAACRGPDRRMQPSPHAIPSIRFGLISRAIYSKATSGDRRTRNPSVDMNPETGTGFCSPTCTEPCSGHLGIPTMLWKANFSAAPSSPVQERARPGWLTEQALLHNHVGVPYASMARNVFRQREADDEILPRLWPAGNKLITF